MQHCPITEFHCLQSIFSTDRPTCLVIYSPPGKVVLKESKSCAKFVSEVAQKNPKSCAKVVRNFAYFVIVK